MCLFDDNITNELPNEVQVHQLLIQIIEDAFVYTKLKNNINERRNNCYNAQLDCLLTIEKYLDGTLEKQFAQHLWKLGVKAWNVHAYDSKIEEDAFKIVIWYWMGNDDSTKKVKVDGLKI